MSDPVFVIAEAGVNHNGDVSLAHKLIEAAAAAGADAIKFQTFVASEIATQDVDRAGYQTLNTGVAGSQFDMLKSLELPRDCYKSLVDHARELGIEFMSTPFDTASLGFLVNDVRVSRLKISSGEITNLPFLVEAAHSGLPVLLSTGMSDTGEISEALDALAFGYSNKESPKSRSEIEHTFRRTYESSNLAERITILHCTSQYPMAPLDANLRVIPALAERFKLKVGYSDHSNGIQISMIAASLGASVIEKHITLDRSMAGPDHAASLEPEEFLDLVVGIRLALTALGTAIKRPTSDEENLAQLVRKSIVAARQIHSGATITADDVALRRASTGLSAKFYWDVIGRTAPRDFFPNEALEIEFP